MHDGMMKVLLPLLSVPEDGEGVDGRGRVQVRLVVDGNIEVAETCLLARTADRTVSESCLACSGASLYRRPESLSGLWLTSRDGDEARTRSVEA